MLPKHESIVRQVSLTTYTVVHSQSDCGLLVFTTTLHHWITQPPVIIENNTQWLVCGRIMYFAGILNYSL